MRLLQPCSPSEKKEGGAKVRRLDFPRASGGASALREGDGRPQVSCSWGRRTVRAVSHPSLPWRKRTLCQERDGNHEWAIPFGELAQRQNCPRLGSPLSRDWNLAVAKGVPPLGGSGKGTNLDAYYVSVTRNPPLWGILVAGRGSLTGVRFFPNSKRKDCVPDGGTSLLKLWLARVRGLDTCPSESDLTRPRRGIGGNWITENPAF